jgi:hypothetical protein
MPVTAGRAAGALGLALAAVCLPNLLRSSCCEGGNEVAAIATLRDIARCQRIFRDARIIDVDGDGRGEAGHLGEMSAAVGPRLDARGTRRGPVHPPCIFTPRNLRPAGAGGVSLHAGYGFALLLPARGGGWVGEHGGIPADSPPLPLDAAVDEDLAEEGWLALAWPVVHGTSGNRVFLVAADGRVLQGDNARHRWEGAAAVPIAVADALPPDGTDGRSLPTAGFVSAGGKKWRPTR